jgi:hypothetical protein
MRYLFLVLFMAGCALTKRPCPPCPEAQTVYIHDTVPVPFPVPCDNDSLYAVIDSMDANIDTLARRLLYAKLALSHVEYYADIVARNPSQAKFIRGWLRRIEKPKLCKECMKKLSDPTKN